MENGTLSSYAAVDRDENPQYTGIKFKLLFGVKSSNQIDDLTPNESLKFMPVYCGFLSLSTAAYEESVPFSI